MRLYRFVAALVALLTFSFGLFTFSARAADFNGTSYENPAVMTPPDNTSNPSKPPSSSKSPSSKSPSSSKSPDSSKESSSKRPSSSKPTSSRQTSSRKTSSQESSSGNQSSNNFLKSLRVVNRAQKSVSFALTPAFDKNTLSYSISVPTDVSGVAIYGKAEDSAAKVQYKNITTLTDGKINRLSVTCIAQNGQKRVYTLNVARGTVTSSDMISSTDSSKDLSSGNTIPLPPVVIGDLSSSDVSLMSVPSATTGGSSLLLGIFAWVFLLGGLAIVVLVILNGSPAKKSIGSSAVGAYTPSPRQSRAKKPRKKAKKRLLGASYYSKYSRYKH